MRKSHVFAAFTSLIIILLSGCTGAHSGKQTSIDKEPAEIQEINVTSVNIHDGIWDTAITNTANGENRFPELSWTGVPDAAEYAIYMIDPDGNGWLHWRAYGIKDTHLNGGEQVAESEYIGPYPPSGTHRYAVTVYALRSPADEYPGNFDAGGNDMDEIEEKLDMAGGEAGNILGKGSLAGTYTAGD